ncbi:MFS transporter [Bradyrhizobium sp. SSUT112]|uniref:MFS transporter n=1 Tax=Bradyrhizobium sp. SSUT112 TaxID=3040604 RepID=UPI00244C0CA5|nr:MFS transporter [Bradyrhizobium sp. SSUT112]MDH2352305.1 MFS transporter [Bradyrhizobium sp. SSUT112]
MGLYDHSQQGRLISSAQGMAVTGRPRLSERQTIILLSAVAFVVALSSIIIFPLGPFLADSLGFPPQQVGFLGSSYSIAAAVGGFVAAGFLDRFDRRIALVACALGFVAATAVCATATNIVELVVMRALAGLFAGPLWGLLIAIASDNVPPERRGAAVGILIGAYGLALIAGLPLGVMVAASDMGWQMNFVGIAAITLILAGIVSWQIGTQRQHLAELRTWNWSEQHAAMIELVTARASILAFMLIASASYAALLISPNLAIFAVHNAGLSPARLADVYLLGGIVSVLVMPLTGRLVDSFGATSVSIAVAVVTTGLLGVVFIGRGVIDLPAIPLFALVIAFQLVRSTVNQAWVTRVPAVAERAAFQSLIAAVTNLAQAAGAASAPFLLNIAPGGQLVGMDAVALLALAMTWAAPPLLLMLDHALANRPQALPPKSLL